MRRSPPAARDEHPRKGSATNHGRNTKNPTPRSDVLRQLVPVRTTGPHKLKSRHADRLPFAPRSASARAHKLKLERVDVVDERLLLCRRQEAEYRHRRLRLAGVRENGVADVVRAAVVEQVLRAEPNAPERRRSHTA